MERLWLLYFLVLEVLTWEWWESLLIIFQLKLNFMILIWGGLGKKIRVPGGKIELKCFSVGFVLECVHIIFFFREIRECLKLDPDHKECFPFYKVSIIIIIIIIIIMMIIIIIIIIIIMIKIIIIIIFTFSASYSSKFNKPLNNGSKLDKQFLLQFPFHLWHSKSIYFAEVLVCFATT